MEYRLYLIICLIVECKDFPFAVYHETESYRLHTSGRELRLDLSPEDRGQFETDKTVKYPACLLCIHKAHVDVARILDGIKDGRFGDFVEDNSSCVLLIEPEGFEQMP